MFPHRKGEKQIKDMELYIMDSIGGKDFSSAWSGLLWRLKKTRY
jgi:hypothetical protein